MGDNDHHTRNGIHGVPPKRGRGKKYEKLKRSDLIKLAKYNSFSKGGLA